MTAKSEADVSNSQAQGSTGAATQFDMGTDRAKFTAHDVDKDTGSDERLEVTGVDRSDAWFQNGKRTYDLHQTIDTQALLTNQQNIQYSVAQRDRHTELAFQDERARKNELHQQTMRHYEDMHTIRYNFSSGAWAETLEEISQDLKEVKSAVCK